jgi:hypothetical protein
MAMTKKKQTKKKEPTPGQRVILTALPPGFIDDLPSEDQAAISAMVGKPVMLSEYDEDGRAVVEFKDKRGMWHGLYLDPKFIEPRHRASK